MRGHLKGGNSVRCPHEGCSSQLSTLGSLKNHLSLYHRSKATVTQGTGGCDRGSDAIHISMDTTGTNPEELPTYRGSTRTPWPEEVERDIPEDDSTTESSFFQSFVLFLLKLEAKHLVPGVVIQEIVEDLRRLHQLSQQQLQEKLIEGIRCARTEEQREQVISQSFKNDAFASAVSDCGSLRSAYCRKKFYTENFSHVVPVCMSLGMDKSNERRHYHYVPVTETLQVLLRDQTVSNCLISSPRPRQDTIYTDFTDGQVFRTRPTNDQDKLSLILYQDAFDPTNPLGPSRGTYKMLAVYLTLGNLPSFVRSHVDQQQLVLLCREKDVKHFGCDAVFSRLVHELKVLEDEGITSCGVHYKVALTFIAGDNLGSHFIGGFVEHFSSGTYVCRYCDVTMDAFQNGQLEGNLRTVESYELALQEVQQHPNLRHFHGVKCSSPFNALSQFHVCMPGLPPCLGHDLLEGIVDFDMGLMINHFVHKLKWFTYSHLNIVIASKFKYSSHDVKNKPSRVPIDKNVLGGNAMQNCTLLLLFPLMVADKVLNASEDMWQLLLALQEIVEFVMAPAISASQVSTLSLLIVHYIQERKRLFPDVPLRPKHHYLVHYPYLITQFGPLIRTWTLRFESKHCFFKRCVRASGNFINLTKSLAEKHQFLQMYLQCTGLCEPPVYYKELLPLSELNNLDQLQTDALQQFFKETSGLCYAPTVTIHGTCYKPGSYVLLGGEAHDPCFGEITLIVASRSSLPCLLVRKIESTFLPNYRAYKLRDSTSVQLAVVIPSDLLDTEAFSPYRVLGSLVIRLRSSVVWSGSPRYVTDAVKEWVSSQRAKNALQMWPRELPPKSSITIYKSTTT